MIDIDSQASLSHVFDISADKKSVADVLGGANEGNLGLEDVIQPISNDLSLAPSNILMYTTEMGMISRMGRESILKKSLEGLTKYDVVLIDCPPGMGLLTINGLVASQGVIIPSMPSETDIHGVGSMMESISGIEAAGLSGNIVNLGILIIQFDGRTLEHNRIVEGIKFSGRPLLGVIPRSVRVQEAFAAKKSITDFSPLSKPALAYAEVSEKILKWIKKVNSEGNS